MNSSGIVTLTTDFGLQDAYVGIMKGVILSINPEARVIDISHQIIAGAVFQASVLIREAYGFFPDGTVHVAVVDPGVGSERRPVLVRSGNYFFVGPDNGIFWPVISAGGSITVIHLTESKYFLPDVSHTFHGRDIFAPVAAHLSRGVDPREMGSVISDPLPLQHPTPRQKKDVLYGQVIRVDRFGNLVTNIHRKDLEGFLKEGRPIIRVGKMVVEGVCNTYSEVNAGKTLVMVGSSDYLEIAVNLGRACDRLGRDSDETIGMEVEVGNVEGSIK